MCEASETGDMNRIWRDDWTKETVSVAESGPGVEAEPGENNPCCLHVVIAGPQDSPLEGGTFKLELYLPEE